MLWTQICRASMPGTGPGDGTMGRDMNVPGTSVLDMHVQDHPGLERNRPLQGPVSYEALPRHLG